MKVFLGGTVAGSTWREYTPSGLSILLRLKNKKSVSLDYYHLSSFVCKVRNKGEQSIVFRTILENCTTQLFIYN